MKARPILFSADMIRALLDGRKSQTRRVVKWKARDEGYNLNFSGVQAGFYCGSDRSSGWVLRSREGVGGCWNDRTWSAHCHYGAPGDFLIVREAFAHVRDYDGIDPGSAALASRCFYRADHPTGVWSERDPTKSIRWRPSIHMPRALSRLTLRITDIRVERLQAISYEDAVAEGCGLADMRFEPVADGETWEQTARRLRWPQRTYEQLWNRINGVESWAANPWCWCISFEVIQANVDQALKREAA